MNTLSASGSWRIDDQWSLRFGVGMIQDGKLMRPGHPVQEVQPGGLIAIGLEYFARRGAGYSPSLDYSVFFGGSSAETKNTVSGEKHEYMAFDLRLGARASWIVKDRLFPYVSFRLFGGPVSWALDGADVVGSDIHHYQGAMGSAFTFGALSSFIEWASVGEQGFSVGLSYAL